MVELQIIAKIIETGDFSIIENNCITEEYFLGQKDKNGKDTKGYTEEFNFIKEHYEKYGNVPDKETFLAKFRDIDLPNVAESNEFLVDKLREEYTFRTCLPILRRASEIVVEDANAGVEYLLRSLKEIEVNYNLGGTDIIVQADQRLEHYKERVDKQDDWYFSTGFHELDNIIHGINRKEELFVIFARTNQGKSWILEKIITNIWKQGFNVGYLSPEMSVDSIGYRFDTLYKGFSNKDLVWGTKDLNVEEYEAYIKELKSHPNKFIVATPQDFDNRVTISKLRKWVKQYNLEAIAIDGITYLSDERGRRNDNKTTSLTNISEDLKLLGLELGIPILLVMQANRGGVVDKDGDDTPELESMRDTDGVAFNATKVLSLRQKDDGLLIKIPKNRDGKVGSLLRYLWNINIGEFIYTENAETQTPEEKAERRERKKASGKDIF